ncbi:hypothetical protein [Streptomyces sp. NPDC054784]
MTGVRNSSGRNTGGRSTGGPDTGGAGADRTEVRDDGPARADVERWEARARLALARHSVGEPVSGTVLAEVAAHCAESGEHPQEAFGGPEEFARTVAEERLPAEGAAPRDPDGWTAGDYGTAVAGQTGLLALAAGAYLTVADGLLVDVTAGGLAGSAGVAAAVAAVHGVPLALRAGRRGRAVGCAVAALVAVCASAAAFTALPDGTLVRAPAAGLCVLGVLLLAWALLHGGNDGGDGCDGSAGGRSPGAADGELPPGALPSEEWLRRLPRLLEGRYAFSAARARELTADAARHVAESGRRAEDEFGPVTAYARTLAGTEPHAARRRWWRVWRWTRREDVRYAAALAFLGTYLAHDLRTDAPLWLTAVAALGTLASAALLVASRARGAR